MPPVVCIVGSSNAGKTTLVEGLVGEFKRRGYRVATVKHSPRGFDLDQKKKDSWRHVRAGSDAVVVSSPERLALIRRQDHDASLEEVVKLIGDDFDIVLAEGFKEASAPKIQVLRAQPDSPSGEPPQGLIALVTDAPSSGEVPRFSPGDVSPLADLIERTLMGKSARR